MRWLWRMMGAVLLAAVVTGCGSTSGDDALVLQFVSFDSTGITQADSVRENSADVDILQDKCCSVQDCSLWKPELFTQTIINATFRNNEAADLHLQQVVIAVGSLATITHQIDGELRGGRCSSSIDQQCSADADCISTSSTTGGGTSGTCTHTETTINGILLFDFSDKQRFLSRPGTYNVTITFFASDPVHSFQISTGYTVTFDDYDNCSVTGG
jgi:hypothetical protein